MALLSPRLLLVPYVGQDSRGESPFRWTYLGRGIFSLKTSNFPVLFATELWQNSHRTSLQRRARKGKKFALVFYGLTPPRRVSLRDSLSFSLLSLPSLSLPSLHFSKFDNFRREGITATERGRCRTRTRHLKMKPTPLQQSLQRNLGLCDWFVQHSQVQT